MSYFQDHYNNFKFALKVDPAPGLRPAQLGAIHAAAAHFVTRSEPAIITMPTGSGKTAVLIAAAFVLRAKRVLIVAPSRLVREQIVEEVTALPTLRDAGALPADIAGPSVFNVKNKVTSADAWEALRAYDVIVGTVQSISPAIYDIPDPPIDLFDLVLVDEAHHSPAKTWKALLDHFLEARKLLFTATPFRQDQREIKGRFIFTYDLKQAYADKVFGEITYQPVTPTAGEDHDVAIAKAAERQLATDRSNGFDHRLMVRTDSRRRAAELLELYQKSTALRLAVVTGDKSLRYAKQVVGDLKSGQLDGIVCVNMLGEGFNFPNLKVAAIHSPHRSLAVTLQFIGRFARTAGVNLGPATFLAIPSEIEIEAEHLYDSQAVWQEIVQNLSAARVTQEIEVREILESFTPDSFVSEDLSDLSLYVLEPYYHVKIYQLDDPVDLTDAVEFPPNMQVVYSSHSAANTSSIYITREISLPRWSTDDRLASVISDLFIFYYDAATKLLFVCASRRTSGIYAFLIESFSHANPRPLPLPRINRALNELKSPEFFNVGMRNRVASNTMESYRIIAGSNADKAIAKSDGRLYHRGHAFGRATDDGEEVTIGLSSASKIWSNKSSQLPDLIKWCSTLARRISLKRTPTTNSGLDYLEVGEEISELPNDILAVDWPKSVYLRPPRIKFEDSDGQTRLAQLLDVDLHIDRSLSGKRKVVVVFDGEHGLKYEATFSFDTDRFFEPVDAKQREILVELDRDMVPFDQFLNDAMPVFYTADLAFIEGYTMVPAADDMPPLDVRAITCVDWAAENVDIQREFGPGSANRRSVHTYLQDALGQSDADVVYYDHGTGEIADFVTLKQDGQELLVCLYHCKKAGGAAPGHRVDDVYEIAGQAVKSVTWTGRQKIADRIRRRFQGRVGSHTFVKGDLATLEKLLADTFSLNISFEVVAVQPGLMKRGLPTTMANVLAAASDYLARGGLKPLRIIASD